MQMVVWYLLVGARVAVAAVVVVAAAAVAVAAVVIVAVAAAVVVATAAAATGAVAVAAAVAVAVAVAVADTLVTRIVLNFKQKYCSGPVYVWRHNYFLIFIVAPRFCFKARLSAKPLMRE